MEQITRFEVGDVLRTAGAVYARNLVTFLGLLLCAFAPVLIWLAAQFALAASDNLWVLLLALLGAVVPPICGYWLHAGVTYCVIRDQRGGQPPFLEVAAQAFRAAPYAIVAALLAGLVIGLGFLLLVIPGILLFLALWVVLPVAVVERRLGSALTRSRELTRGHRWPILGVTILFLFAALAAVIALIAMLAPMASPDGILMAALTLTLGFIVQSFWATLVAVGYHRLRVLREGDGKGIAEVFE